MSKYRHTTSKEQRKEEIIKYLKKNPYQEEKEVLKFCINEGIGSKVTVSDAITELIAEGVLNPGKERKNSKSYKLSVNSDNLLLTIPQDLEEIFAGFKEFVKNVSSLYKNLSKLDEEELESFKSTWDYYNSIESIQTLPYNVLEIINKIYLFYFRFVLPIEIKNWNIRDRLFSEYNEKVSEMYSFISQEMDDHEWMKEISDISKSLIYKSYLDSETWHGFGKVKFITRICKMFNIKDALFNVLDLLWIKNHSFVALVYELDFLPEEVYEKYLRLLNKTFSDYDYDHNELKKIHIQLDYYLSDKKIMSIT